MAKEDEVPVTVTFDSQFESVPQREPEGRHKWEGMVAAVASCEAVRVYSYRKYGGATEKLIDSRIEAALAEREVEDE